LKIVETGHDLPDPAPINRSTTQLFTSPPRTASAFGRRYSEAHVWCTQGGGVGGARAGRVSRRLTTCKDTPIVVAAIHAAGHRTGPGSDSTATYLTPFWLGEVAGAPYTKRIGRGGGEEWWVDVFWYEEAPVEERAAPAAAAAAAAAVPRQRARRARRAAAPAGVEVDCQGPPRVTYIRPSVPRCRCKQTGCKKIHPVPIPVVGIRPPLQVWRASDRGIVMQPDSLCAPQRFTTQVDQDCFG